MPAPRRGVDRRALARGGAVVALAVAVGAVLFGGGDDDGGGGRVVDPTATSVPGLGSAPSAEGEPAPAAAFTRFDGSEGSLADYRGRPLVVNFFASWCVPCIEEMPAFERVHQAIGDRVAFLGLNVQDQLEDGRGIARRTEVTYDLARDPRGDLLTAFGGQVMPTTALVSADGTVVEVHGGELSEDELQALIEDELLA